MSYGMIRQIATLFEQCKDECGDEPRQIARVGEVKGRADMTVRGQSVAPHGQYGQSPQHGHYGHYKQCGVVGESYGDNNLRRKHGHFEHSKSRARERYGLLLTPEVESEMLRRASIRAPHLSRFIGRYSLAGDEYEVFYARRWYRIGIDVKRGCIMTFLPPIR